MYSVLCEPPRIYTSRGENFFWRGAARFSVRAWACVILLGLVGGRDVSVRMDVSGVGMARWVGGYSNLVVLY